MDKKSICLNNCEQPKKLGTELEIFREKKKRRFKGPNR